MFLHACFVDDVYLQVNQKTSTIEQAERTNMDFLTRFSSSLVWGVRHWANKWQLLATLAPTIGAEPK